MRCREVRKCSVVQRGSGSCGMGTGGPTTQVVDKNQEGSLGSEQSNPQARPYHPGYQCWEDKFPKLLSVKTSGGWGGGRNCWIFRQLLLKGPHSLKTHANRPVLRFNTRATAGRVPVANGESVK